jgi:hypothetical protein
LVRRNPGNSFDIPESGLAIGALLSTGGVGLTRSGTLEGGSGHIGLTGHGSVGIGSTGAGSGTIGLVGEGIEVLERHFVKLKLVREST